MRRQQAELLDDPPAVIADLAANLADIRRLNRWFGGTRLALRYVRPLVRATETLTVLDVATGSADIPLALVRWARKRGCSVEVTGVDLSPEILSIAARQVGTEDIPLKVADARSLPFPDTSFDVVLCALALHHFEPARAVEALSEMWRVTRRRLIVLDLSRGYFAYLGTWLVTRTVARNRLTRHDGPLSVLRAYTAAEMRELAVRADLGNRFHIHRRPFFRLALVVDKDLSHGS